MEYKVIIRADQLRLDEVLQFCKDRWGHRGKSSGWYWRVRSTYKAGEFVFSFAEEEDALIFKLSKG